LAKITKIGECRDEFNGTLVYVLYRYDRLQISVNLEVAIVANEDTKDFAALDFIFSQYALLEVIVTDKLMKVETLQ
jgi:hypothetical protein